MTRRRSPARSSPTVCRGGEGRGDGAPDRQEHRITADSRAVLAAWLASEPERHVQRDPFLARVFFGIDLVGLSLGALVALLATSGEKDSAAVRRSLATIAGAAPRALLRTAPGMHRIWNVEDVDLFNEVLRAWLAGIVDARLHNSVTAR